MSVASEEKQVVFIECPSCRGKRYLGKLKLCQQCQGLGKFYSLGKKILYWAYGLVGLHIMLRRWDKAIQNSINGVLYALLIVNAFVIYQISATVEYDIDQLTKTIFLSYHYMVGLFWVLLLFHLYLFYRIYHQLTSPKGTIDTSEKSRQKTEKVNIADALSPSLIKILDNSWDMVRRNRQFPIRPLQLFYALLGEKDVNMILARLGVSSVKLKASLERQIAFYTPEKTDDEISAVVKDCLLNAYLSAFSDRSKHVRPTDLLWALVAADEKLKEILYDMQVDLVKVANVIKWINFNNQLLDRYRRFRSKSVYKPKGAINRSYTAAATPYLDSFSSDLTQMARAGQLSLSVARENEINETFRVMEGGASVVLVGENGVGKFNLIEGLANRMVAEEVPKMFRDKRLVNLSLSFLVAGAGRTGEVQERLLLVVQEILRSGNIILVIEDVHNLVGVSSAGTENIDLSEVLAREIQSRGIKVVSTTSPAEMTEFIERSALAGALERIVINEPDKNQAIQILEANVGPVEAEHKVFFTYESLEKIIDLSDRYLHNQFLPAKAINLMKEAGAWIAQKESKLITGEDIAALISRKTSIPLTRVSEQESKVLLNLEEIIHQRIIGQDEAVKLVVSALRRARAELRDEQRPIVNLLFLGPTGVGKTELAKTVAANYFGDEEAMVRLDMSEYQRQASIARLLGAPGSGRGGILTEKVRANPFALLLLDEIEKAHPDILNIFLQVMDDGRLTDALGRTVDFTNVILVGTSNAEAHFIQDEVRKQTPVKEIKDMLVRGKLREEFKPEFLNRFDGIVVFKPLTTDEIFQIAGLMLNKVAKRLKAKGIALQITEAAQKELAQAGFDPVFGARPLRRVIQERVEEALANYLLRGDIGRRDVVTFDVGNKINVVKAKKL